MKVTAKMLAGLAILTLLGGCRVETEQGDETSVIDDELPTNSTGKTGSLTLSFSSGGSFSLAEADEPVKISEAIELSYAKFNIAKIKIKAGKNRTEAEESLEEEEIATEEEAVADFEGMLLTSDEHYLKRDNANRKNASTEKEDRAAKIKENQSDLHGKEVARIKNEGSRDRATKFFGPYVYDAIKQELEEEPPKVELVDGNYYRIEFQLKRNFTADEEELLLGNVFAIKGTFSEGEESIPFEIEWHSALNFRLVADSPFSVDTADDNSLLIELDMSLWFDGIDLASADVDDDGTIYINKLSNKELMRKLRRNIKVTSGFGKDANGDGKLQKDEKSGKGQDTNDAP